MRSHIAALTRASIHAALIVVVVGSVPEAANATGWLSTSGNQILDASGNHWYGRGANITDTFQNQQCYGSTNPNEVIRRLNVLINTWGATFIRLDLDSSPYSQSQITNNSSYLSAIQAIVNYAANFNGVYVLVTVWQDPTVGSDELPSTAEDAVLQQLVDTFWSYSNVMFGISNEPHNNSDSTILSAMNARVNTIRAREDYHGSNRHIITVQGGNYAGSVAYYTNNNITAYSGVDIAYEVHVYNGPSAIDWNQILFTPAQSIPVIVGEYGPAEAPSDPDDYQCGYFNDNTNRMSLSSDIPAFQQACRNAGVPYLAWTFDEYAPPNLIQGPSGVCTGGSCDYGMTISPTSWGTAVYNDLQTPWGPSSPSGPSSTSLNAAMISILN